MVDKPPLALAMLREYLTAGTSMFTEREFVPVLDVTVSVDRSRTLSVAEFTRLAAKFRFNKSSTLSPWPVELLMSRRRNMTSITAVRFWARSRGLGGAGGAAGAAGATGALPGITYTTVPAGAGGTAGAGGAVPGNTYTTVPTGAEGAAGAAGAVPEGTGAA